MKNILILGSSGLLGLNLFKFLSKKKNYKIIRFKRKKNYNFNNVFYCKKYLVEKKIDIIINLSAVTNVDECEKNFNKAKKINHELVKNICSTVRKNNLDIFLIQLSTDQFYNKFRNNNEKYFKLVNNYAKSKYLAEKEALKINSSILRTNFFGKSKDKNRLSFSDWIYKKLKSQQKINLADDIFFSPLSIISVCKLIFLVLKKKYNGIYNIGSRNGFSKYKFGIKFAKKLNLETNLIKKVSYNNINFYAKRNKDMRMKLKKFENKFKYKFKDLDFEINKVIKDYRK